MTNIRIALTTLLSIIAVALISGCSTAPKAENQEVFIDEARAATRWFERQVPGLKEQINNSAGYLIYPSVGQWGIVFGGGQYGRAMVNKPNGTQIGWGALNTGSFGLQAGVRGFKMLVVIQDEATMEKFKANKLSGSVTGVVVVAQEGTSAVGRFENGVAIYQGASSGLMAGVNVALDYLRYQPLGYTE
ncbi:MAG: hypothetical protein KF912_06280 [Phycisphaeraceae bacterium]|nr:hypothetical protein [Phycisphaeraceae bacterium]MBX3366907.1 hypothetical protein [Phycisphaeraceae bacterium]